MTHSIRDGDDGEGRSSSGESSKAGMRLVYPYAPLASSLDYLIRSSSLSSSGHGGVVANSCTKAGLWGLRYGEESTAQEFMRFCHRDLTGAVIMLILLIGVLSGITELDQDSLEGNSTRILVVVQAFAFALEMFVHCWAQSGEKFSPKMARLRHIAHIAAAVSVLSAGTWSERAVDLRCDADPNYERVHGHQPSETSRYLFCVRSIAGQRLAMIALGLFTLHLNIYLHWLLSHYWLLILTLGLLFVPNPETNGLVWVDTASEIAVRVLVALVCVQVSNLAAVAKHRSLQRAFEAALEVHYQMRASKQRLDSIDSLLCSMVPPSALSRLMADTKVLDAEIEGTVFFSDMVQFTRWSSVRTPSQVVEMLSVLIRAFDMLAADMGVDKVKTIGDCYWAVTGIPLQMDRHAEVMVNFGLAFLVLVKRQSRKYISWDYPEDASAEVRAPAQEWHVRRPIEFRVGIHSGPVLGGVLGSQQISYEVFGETSNTASLVEQKGKPMHVVVSANTKRMLRRDGIPAFDFAPHGTEAQVVVSTMSDDEDPSPDESGNVQEDGDANLNSVANDALSSSLLPKLYVVLPVSMEERSQSEASQSGQATRSVGEQEAETDAARAERRRFVESHLLSKASRDSSGAKLELGQATFGGLMELYATRKFACALYTFADPAIEADFRVFVMRELMDFRLWGAVAMLAVLLIFFVLILVDGAVALPPACLCLVLASLLLLCLAAGLLFQKRVVIQSDQKTQEETTQDSNKNQYLEFGITHTAMACWLMACAFVPDSVVSNKTDYILTVFFLLLSLPNLHLPTVAIIGANTALLIICYVDMVLRGPFFIFVVTVFPLGLFWYVMVTVLLEKRLRIQYLESKAANHFAQQQLVAVQAQEAVLGSIVPDFVIAPLMAWLASDFDPLKTVVQNYDEVCVAFMRFSPPSVPEAATTLTTAEESTKWLYRGHRAVDEVLAQSSVVDKVKTVGDLVMVGGSFRGHSSQEAALEMLRVAVTIHDRFCDASGQSSVTIGIHAGPVMGIVLGYSRLAFDIFGDTVNTASRVMTCSVAKHAIAVATSVTSLLPSNTPFDLSQPSSWEWASREDGGKCDGGQAVIQPRRLSGQSWVVGVSSPVFAPAGNGNTTIEYGPPCEVTVKGKGVLRVRQIVYNTRK